jgi:hypothetical protein
LCRRAPQPAPLTRRVGRGQQRERLGIWPQAAYLAQEVLLEPLAQRKRFRQAGAAGELVGGVLGTEFHQRERVIAGVGQDAVNGLRGQGPASHRAEQLTGLGVGQAIHRDGRKLLEHLLAGRLAYAGDEADAVGMQAAGDETEHLRRLGIQPVRVINDAQQRLCLSRPGKQRERRQSHQEPFRRRSCFLTESDPQRAPLRRRQLVQLRQARDQQLMQATERHADLRLDTGNAGNPQVRRRGDRVLEQRRLPDPRSAAQHQRSAEATAHRGQDLVDRRPLGVAVKEHEFLPPPVIHAPRPGPVTENHRCPPPSGSLSSWVSAR